MQALVIPVSDRFNDYAEQVTKQLLDAGLRVEANLKDDRVSYKIREASLKKLPYALVVGERETAAGTINVRSRDAGELGEMPVAAFLARIACENVPGGVAEGAAAAS